MSAEPATPHPTGAPHTGLPPHSTRVASTIDGIADITGMHPLFVFTTFMDALLYEYQGRPPTTPCPIRALGTQNNYTAHHTLTRRFATATAHLYAGLRETNRDLLTPLTIHYTNLTTVSTDHTVLISTPRADGTHAPGHVTLLPPYSNTTYIEALLEKLHSQPNHSHDVIIRTSSEVAAKTVALLLGFLPTTITGFVTGHPPDTDHPTWGYWIQDSTSTRIQAVQDSGHRVTPPLKRGN